MGILTPRTISITRIGQPPKNHAGAQAYSEETESTETPLFSGIPCTITSASGRISANRDMLPGDSPGPEKYIIAIFGRGSPINDGGVIEGDFVYDDINRRFMVGAANFDALGISFDVIRVVT